MGRPDWQRLAVGVVLALIVLTLLFGRSANFRPVDGPEARPYGGDFIHEYSAAWIVREGDPTRLYDFDTVYAVQHDRDLMGFEWDHRSVNVPYYPPWYYLVVSPLAALPYRTAAYLWTGFLVACFAAAVAMLAWSRPALWPALPWALPGALLFPPLHHSLVSGQKATFWLLLFTAIYVLLRRGRPFAAGAVFGLLAFKPPLVLVLGPVMLIKRQWRFLAGAAATSLLLLALGLTLGSEVLVAWLQAMWDPVSQDKASLLVKAHCWLGFARLALGSYGGIPVWALTVGLIGVTLTALSHLLRGPLDCRDPDFGLQYSGILLATVLVSPHLYTYDLAILLLVFAILGVESQAAEDVLPAWGKRLRYALFGVFVLTGAATILADPLALQVGVASVFGLLASVSLQPVPASAAERA